MFFSLSNSARMKAMFVEHLFKTKSKAVSLIQHEHMHTATKTDSIDYSQDTRPAKRRKTIRNNLQPRGRNYYKKRTYYFILYSCLKRLIVHQETPRRSKLNRTVYETNILKSEADLGTNNNTLFRSFKQIK